MDRYHLHNFHWFFPNIYTQKPNWCTLKNWHHGTIRPQFSPNFQHRKLQPTNPVPPFRALESGWHRGESWNESQRAKWFPWRRKTSIFVFHQFPARLFCRFRGVFVLWLDNLVILGDLLGDLRWWNWKNLRGLFFRYFLPTVGWLRNGHWWEI